MLGTGVLDSSEGGTGKNLGALTIISSSWDVQISLPRLPNAYPIVVCSQNTGVEDSSSYYLKLVKSHFYKS